MLTPAHILPYYFPSWRTCLTQSVSAPLQQKLGLPHFPPLFQQNGNSSTAQPTAPDAPAFAYPDYYAASQPGQPSAFVAGAGYPAFPPPFPPSSHTGTHAPASPEAAFPLGSAVSSPSSPASPGSSSSPGYPADGADGADLALTGTGPDGSEPAGPNSGTKSITSTLGESLGAKLSRKLGQLFHRKPELPVAPETAPTAELAGVKPGVLPGGKPATMPEGKPEGPPENPAQPVSGQKPPAGKPGESGQPAIPPNPAGIQRMTAPPGWKPGDPEVKTGPWSDTILPQTVEQIFQRGTKGLYRYTKRPHYSLKPEQIRVNYPLQRQECLEKLVYSMKWNDDDAINPFSDRVLTEH